MGDSISSKSSESPTHVKTMEPPTTLDTSPIKGPLSKFRSHLARMREKRSSLIAHRVQLQEQRTQLRAGRDDAIDLDAKFTKALTAFASKPLSPEAEALLNLCERVQSAKTHYLAKEDDYNLLESALDQSEWELKELEGKLYRQLDNLTQVPRLFGASSIEPIDQSDLISSSSASTTSGRVEYHPLLRDLLSRLGDADMVNEQLTDLRAIRAQNVEQQRTLRSLGQELDEAGIQFLADFDANHKQLQSELSKISTDISGLRRLCREEHLLEDDTSYDLDEEVILHGNESFVPDPLLVDRPKSLPDLEASNLQHEDQSSSRGVPPALDTLRQTKSSDALTYINDWFLWRLRRSSLEVKRYKSASALDQLRDNEPYLSNLILKNWNKDSAGELLSNPRKLPKSLTAATGHDAAPSYGTAQSDSIMPILDGLTSRLHEHGFGTKLRSSLQTIGIARRSSEPDFRTIVSF
ncbi:MAG: hypothetical protein Q9227_008168 [Pyrenula ochraceoflavens]